jgi:hypothetical protein
VVVQEHKNMVAGRYGDSRREGLGQSSSSDTGQFSSCAIQRLWPPPVQFELEPGSDASERARHPWRLNKDEHKGLQILLLLIVTPYLALLMVTAGPPAMRLLLSLLHVSIE